jgi:hypothetical protein
MRALLRQQGLAQILDGKVPSTSTDEYVEFEEKAYGEILLSLSDGVLKEVADEEKEEQKFIFIFLKK